MHSFSKAESQTQSVGRTSVSLGLFACKVFSKVSMSVSHCFQYQAQVSSTQASQGTASWPAPCCSRRRAHVGGICSSRFALDSAARTASEGRSWPCTGGTSACASSCMPRQTTKRTTSCSSAQGSAPWPSAPLQTSGQRPGASAAGAQAASFRKPST